jgi:hypothetical protein
LEVGIGVSTIMGDFFPNLIGMMKWWNVMMQDLAFDLSLAALLGDNIYNFGELLAHPIVNYWPNFHVSVLLHTSAISRLPVVHFGFAGCWIVNATSISIQICRSSLFSRILL